MNRQRSGAAGAPRVLLLSAGLTLASGPAGWTADAQLGPPEPLLKRSRVWLQAGFAEQHPLSQPATQQHTAPLERATAGSDARSHRTRREEVDLAARTAPRVKVRAGHHGEFERVAFEWPEAVEYDVVQHDDQVTIAFSRPGAIDLSRINDHLGPLVLDAWAEEGAVAGRVALRVLPNVRVRSFSLEGGRIVAIDVFGGTAAQALAPSAPDPEQEAILELRQALEQRDAAIESLLARVEQLERIVALPSGNLDRVTAGRAVATPSLGDMPPPRLASPPVADIEAPSREPSGTSRAAPSISAPPEQPSATISQGQDAESTGARTRRETAQSQAPAPGQVEVEEEEVDRALDFTLVQEGALLLPAGRAEVTPRFSYTRRTNDFPTIVNGNLLGEREVRRNEFDFFGGLQVGLPLDSQLEMGLPYNLVDQSTTDRVGGGGFREQSDTGYGLGDFSVGLAKTVLREERWWPDVILRANWDSGTGERQNNDVVLDGGFQDLTGSLSLTKRQDPLVFVGGGFYEWAYDETDDIDPGDQFGFTAGTFLAASPNTSLSVVLSQSFIDEFKVSGQRIDGSDRVESILSLGAAAVLGRNVLLSGNVGVGLTDDSPDYSVTISLPIRFGIPGL
jgi:hypothetical protein